MSSKPSLYLDSKLFHRPVRDVRGQDKSMTVPDPQLEPLEPDADESVSETRKATALLKDVVAKIDKAGATQESGEGWVPESQQQRRRGYDRSFLRDSRGISGGASPDLPEQGRDWHGTVPGVPDEPRKTDEEDLDRPPVNLVDSTPDSEEPKKINDEAKKALAAAPRFSPGPFVAPREREFLRMRGWSNEDIESGQASMSPRLRAEFNKWLTSSVQKSISSFINKSLG